MKNKKITKFIAGVSSLCCFGGASKKTQTSAFGLEAILAYTKVIESLTTSVNKIVGLTYWAHHMKRNSKVGLKNFLGGFKCLYRPDLNPELFQCIGDAEKKSFFEIMATRVLGVDKQIKSLQYSAVSYLLKKTDDPRSGPNNYGFLMSGPSGCGKSMLAKVFSHSFVSDGFNPDGTINEDCKSVFKLSSANIDSNSKETIWNQLLADVPSVDKDSAIATNPFRAYLEANPNGGIIIFDEFEKVYSSSLAEGIRNILDSGELTVGGIKYPIRNYIFIFTTNASPESINPKFDKVPELTTAEKELGYTKCNFDKSFLNRLTLVPFEPLSADVLGTIFYELMENWNIKNFENGVQLTIDLGDKESGRKSTISEIARYLKKTNKGGREAEKLFDTLLNHLYFLTKKIQYIRNDERYNVPGRIDIEIKFDEKNGRCYIDDVDTDKFLVEESAPVTVLDTLLPKNDNVKDDNQVDDENKIEDEDHE